jgi:hypothetical protein
VIDNERKAFEKSFTRKRTTARPFHDPQCKAVGEIYHGPKLSLHRIIDLNESLFITFNKQITLYFSLKIRYSLPAHLGTSALYCPIYY